LSARDQGTSDRIGGRGPDYHRKVANAFRQFADAAPARFAVIDGDGAADAVHRAVLAAIESRP